MTDLRPKKEYERHAETRCKLHHVILLAQINSVDQFHETRVSRVVCNIILIRDLN